MISLTTPPEEKLKEIESIFINMFGIQKLPRVAKGNLIQSYGNGGFQKICLETFSKSLKITWVCRFYDNARISG